MCPGGQVARNVRRHLRRSTPQRTSQNDTCELVDKFGHRHSTAVLTTWSPRLLEIMGICPQASKKERAHSSE